MKVGEVLDGRYELVELIGQGGMGEVWKARDRSGSSTQGPVALKVLHPHLMIEKELISRFLREAKAALEARYSAHIIEVLDVVHQSDRPPYLVMEHLVGDNLGQLIEREGPFETTRAVDLTIQICDALDEVHRQELIHRDIKPDNLFVTRLPGGGEWIKLLDFGVVKFSAIATSAPRLTNVGSTIGTPEYMAPEQAMAPDKIDLRVDVYGVGVVLYELLTGRRPYEADDFQEILLKIARKELVPPIERRPEIGTELNEIVLEAMAMDPDERFGSTLDLNLALQPFSSTPHPQGISTSQTIMEDISTTVIKSLWDSQADTERGDSSQFGLGPIDTDPGTPLFLLESNAVSQDDSTPASSETDSTPSPIPAPLEPEQRVGAHSPQSDPSRPAEEQLPQSSGEFGQRETNPIEPEPLMGNVEVASKAGMGTEGEHRYWPPMDVLKSALEERYVRVGILIAISVLVIGLTATGVVAIGLNCLCGSRGDDPEDWTSLVRGQQDAGTTDAASFDFRFDASDAWLAGDAVLDDADVEEEEVDHYGGLDRHVVVSALRSLSPVVSSCLKRSKRRPRSRVRVQFWVHKSGVLSFRRTRPPVHRAAEQCLRRSLKGRRLSRPPLEPFVAIYPYVVPR